MRLSVAVLIVEPCLRGREVTSLGVLFDFTGNDDNTTVQKVEDMVKEHWVRIRFRGPVAQELNLAYVTVR